MLVVAIIGLLAGIAIPSFSRARTQAQRSRCLDTLRIIDAAKEMAASANHWTNGTVIAPASEVIAVNAYIKGLAGTTNTPTCPAGGTYDYTRIGVNAACSVAGHVVQP